MERARRRRPVARAAAVLLCFALVVSSLVPLADGRLHSAAAGALALTVDRPTAAVGERITIRATILDPPDGAPGPAYVSIQLPPPLERVSARASRGPCCIWSPGSDGSIRLFTSLGQLADSAGQWVELTATVKIATAAPLGAVLRSETGALAVAELVVNQAANPPDQVKTPVTLTPSPLPGLDRLGTHGPDVLRGTSRADRLDGGSGDDTIIGYRGDDELIGGPGDDTIDAGFGNDTIDTRDGRKDTARCGPGVDAATADTIDVLTDCETVVGRLQ